MMKEWPIAAIDTAGCGGSNFLQVEASQGEFPFAREEIEHLVCTLGHPTAQVVREALPLGIPIIAGGGIRTGLDIAREEKTHVGEFMTLLLEKDKEQVRELEKGKREIEEMSG